MMLRIFMYGMYYAKRKEDTVLPYHIGNRFKYYQYGNFKSILNPVKCMR